MVTNLPFYSGKSFALSKSVPFWVILVFVAGFVFISSDPPVVLFALFIVYGLSGWGVWLFRIRKAKKLSMSAGSTKVE
jgi:CDP-diacylglycerol--serine O-phosphatidyltransferase